MRLPTIEIFPRSPASMVNFMSRVPRRYPVRQKINRTSSTEAELVGVADAMPSIIWTRQFLEAQRIDVTVNIIYQDNRSAILLEKNGRRSSGKRTRHINIKYFHGGLLFETFRHLNLLRIDIWEVKCQLFGIVHCVKNCPNTF
jgi:hypothetical protein